MTGTHRVICRGGEPLCYLPAKPRAAAHTMQLYPAQRRLARVGRGCVRALLRMGVPLPLRRGTPPPLSLAEATWIGPGKEIAGKMDDKLLGVLAGNVHARGRRYVYLLFDSNGHPLCVAKVGFTVSAREKVEAERSFLLVQGAANSAIPPVWGYVANEDMQGLLLPYWHGRPAPVHGAEEDIAPIMDRWIRSEPPRPWDAWDELAVLHSSPFRDELEGRAFTPVLQHGDFAPWNVLVDGQGQWQIIDWERGTDCGVPGWDWFHYLVQPAILVDEAPADQVYRRVQTLIRSTAFQSYARSTGMSGIEWPLFWAYLQHMRTLLDDEQSDRAAALMRAACAALSGMLLDAKEEA